MHPWHTEYFGSTEIGAEKVKNVFKKNSTSKHWISASSLVYCVLLYYKGIKAEGCITYFTMVYYCCSFIFLEICANQKGAPDGIEAYIGSE